MPGVFLDEFHIRKSVREVILIHIPFLSKVYLSSLPNKFMGDFVRLKNKKNNFEELFITDNRSVFVLTGSYEY